MPFEMLDANPILWLKVFTRPFPWQVGCWASGGGRLTGLSGVGLVTLAAKLGGGGSMASTYLAFLRRAWKWLQVRSAATLTPRQIQGFATTLPCGNVVFLEISSDADIDADVSFYYGVMENTEYLCPHLSSPTLPNEIKWCLPCVYWPTDTTSRENVCVGV